MGIIMSNTPCAAPTALASQEYSLQQATQYGWGSLAAQLPMHRVDLLTSYLIGTAVLDAGCGGGAYVDHLSRQGYVVTGIDKFEMFLEQARVKKCQGSFVQADLAERLPFSDKSFDTTFCFDVLEHIDDKRSIVELTRVTRQRLIITVPRQDTTLSQFGLALAPYLDKTHLRHYTPESLRCLLSSVQSADVTIFDESPIDLRAAALKHLRARSRFPLLSGLYERLLQFLLKRSNSSSICMNLAAIIDFPQ